MGKDNSSYIYNFRHEADFLPDFDGCQDDNSDFQ